MPACIEERARPARAVAHEQDRPAGDEPGAEVPVAGNLRIVAEIDPAPVEDPPMLRFENFGIDENPPVEPEALPFRVVDDEGPVHCGH